MKILNTGSGRVLELEEADTNKLLNKREITVIDRGHVEVIKLPSSFISEDQKQITTQHGVINDLQKLANQRLMAINEAIEENKEFRDEREDHINAVMKLKEKNEGAAVMIGSQKAEIEILRAEIDQNTIAIKRLKRHVKKLKNAQESEA